MVKGGGGRILPVYGGHIPILSPAELTRYARQLALEGWDREAQERLKSSRVFMAGAGGLACAAAVPLLAAGLGALRLVDHSRISLSELGHQSLFRERDLGKARAAVAESRLQEINPFSRVEGSVKALTEHNVWRLTSGCHLLLACWDDAGAGALLNQAAARWRLPLVHAWIWGMHGCLTTFWAGRGPCLACAPPEAAPPEAAPAGDCPSLPFPPPPQPTPQPSPQMAPLPGIVGGLQALEALRILASLGPALLGRMLVFNGQRLQFLEKHIKPQPQCPVCRRLSP